MKIALVTGGAKRIGKAVVEGLASDGYGVVIHANRAISEAEEMAEAIRAKGGRALALQADLANPNTYARLIEVAGNELGPISVLINSASIFEADEAPNLSKDQFDAHMRVNLEAPVFLTQEMAKVLPGNQTGVVINFIDQRVWKLTPKFGSYTLSKAALWTATQTMAQALAPKIRVAAIGPGPTLANERQSQADFEKQAKAVLLQNYTTLEDIMSGVRFILNTRSFTGQMLALDGGQHLAWETPDVVGINE